MLTLIFWWCKIDRIINPNPYFEKKICCSCVWQNVVHWYTARRWPGTSRCFNTDYASQ